MEREVLKQALSQNIAREYLGRVCRQCAFFDRLGQAENCRADGGIISAQTHTDSTRAMDHNASTGDLCVAEEPRRYGMLVRLRHSTLTVAKTSHKTTATRKVVASRQCTQQRAIAGVFGLIVAPSFGSVQHCPACSMWHLMAH